MIKRRDALLGTAGTLLAAALPHSAVLAQNAGGSAAGGARVMRYCFPVPETGFDPAQVSDIYSLTVCAHIFESLYTYDHLARPFKIKPLTAVGMPEVADEYRTWTVRIRPGIFFADDPAFKGQKRELTAHDYVFSFKRYFDPATKSPAYSSLKEEGFEGLDELRQQALKERRPFDYEREVPGVRALDRYTLQFRLAQPRPRFLYSLAGGVGAMAREVVQARGERIMEYPVGTGPFRLAQWRRSSLLVLERNPNFREMFYDAEPNADDAEGQAMAARFRGRRLPMLDRVEISIIEENQPRWLSFLNEQLDLMNGIPLDFVHMAVPNGELAPNLAKRGIRMQRTIGSDSTMTYFNMEDPVVGGYTPEKVALRRAISLATDVEREIRLVRRGQAVPAQSAIAPHTWGYDPELVTANSEFSVARAKALLELYGYVDRNGDGWRERPDGSPLVLEYATQPDQISRQFDELWKRNMDAVGLRLVFKPGKWPEQLKAARAGKLMMWGLGSSSGSPDGQGAFERCFGPAAGGGNLSRFSMPEFDAMYRRMSVLPDGPERLALFREANKLVTAYAPYKYHVHRIATDLSHPWLDGFRRPIFWLTFWQYLDVDPARRPRA
ncbi:ABC transporter substrate-binding protein [Caldimonas tepidiphila]|uniref:ABC transporter substrate-binding protein n=1 Tax=Caldimonas tepidiphila TaxID=2315841 RepID=UPI001F0BA3EA|nr:ABC transporter substrate-binding protein [Caldimonas tepidiphila]